MGKENTPLRTISLHIQRATEETPPARPRNDRLHPKTLLRVQAKTLPAPTRAVPNVWQTLQAGTTREPPLLASVTISTTAMLNHQYGATVPQLPQRSALQPVARNTNDN